MKQLFTIFGFLLFTISGFSQYTTLSDRAEISIITCGPGNTELYEAFGHSALRIVDPVQGMDEVYNYGMFNFEAPNFYLNFVKGNMIYKLGRYPIDNFLYGYRLDKRWVKEQILVLNQQEKQQFFNYLENNLIPENRSYSYDPYFNNCSTILRDLVVSQLNNKLVFNDSSTSNFTLRELMNNNIHWNSWGSFGISIALGNKLDKEATYEQAMYLPDHLFKSMKKATVLNDKTAISLVKKERTILNYKEKKQEVFVFNPLLLFTIALLITAFITYKNYQNNTRSKWVDFVLFFSTGLVGLVIVFLWFFSNHFTASHNFNFLWAFAPNLIVSFYLLKDKIPLWIHQYVIILLLFIFVLVIIWVVKIQVFSVALFPLLILLLVRYIYLSKLK